VSRTTLHPESNDALAQTEHATRALIEEKLLGERPPEGDIWWVETEDNSRPVLVITRSQAIPVLKRPVVAPVSRTGCGIPTEIGVGPSEGL
jgi:hypothetical protein